MKKLTLLPALLCALSCAPTLAADKQEKPHRACSLLKIGATALVAYVSADTAKNSLWLEVEE